MSVIQGQALSRSGACSVTHVLMMKVTHFLMIKERDPSISLGFKGGMTHKSIEKMCGACVVPCIAVLTAFHGHRDRRS